MKVLLINTDYPAFLDWLYGGRPDLREADYARQLAERRRTRFGIADFYSRNLTALGVMADELYANNHHLQRAWVREHLPRRSRPQVPNPECWQTGWRRLLHYNPGARLARRARRLLTGRADDRWLYDVLGAQIDAFRPDVIVNQNPNLDPCFFAELRSRRRVLVAQIASPLPDLGHFAPYDLVLSSLPNLVELFRSHGHASGLHRLGFEPDVLQELGPRAPTLGVTFVGQVSAAHSSRARLLAALVERVGLGVWGPRRERTRTGLLEGAWRGEAWGVEMYRVLRASRVTVNHHIDLAGRFANNLRLYEATGVGATLVTDRKDNLTELFASDEVVAYGDADECAEKVEYLLAHPDEAEAIGRRGQARTLRDHTWAQRMAELEAILRTSLAAAGIRP